MQDLICISHLRWDFVWQRPQHLLSRLAEHYNVFFVEEPVTDLAITEPRLETFTGRGDHPVTVIRLHYPAKENFWIGHNDERTQADYERLLTEFFDALGNKDERIVWLYTPMAAPFADALQPDVLVYDVMDELSAFKGAPAALVEADRSMLRRADVTFTGGVSLYRSRLAWSDNIYLFPSGVEIAHFAKATNRLPRPQDIANLNGPILGYFGVIDERMDLDLLRALSGAHPEWEIVLLGPVVKIDPAELPAAPNLHYLGMKEYQELPAYLSNFDVALVPFAMNEATRFLSPTKTLEYLAADKPVVAAPIPDIIELYGDYVRIGNDPEEFVHQVEAALAEAPAARDERRSRVQKLLDLHTWDYIANEMYQLIEAARVPVTTAGELDPASDAAPVDLQTVGGGLTHYVTPEQQKPVNSA